MSTRELRLRGLRAGNLRDIDLDLPHGHWTALHGPSGSGKSALLFGVLEPIARRRFRVLYDSTALPGGDSDWMASLCDEVDGMQPVVCLAGEIPRTRRKKLLRDALNLWPRLVRAFLLAGKRSCPNCSQHWTPPGSRALLGNCKQWDRGATLLVFAEAGGNSSEELLLAGWTRVRMESGLARLEESPPVLPAGAWLLLDRLRWQPGKRQRVEDALQLALRRGGDVMLEVNGDCLLQSAVGRCPQCAHQLGNNSIQALPLAVEAVTDWELDGASWEQWSNASIKDISGLPGEVHDDTDRRLQSLLSTGMGHLEAGRLLGTLSLGESRRLELCAMLSQVRREQLVLFDEPGMGLHGSERRAVVKLLRELVEQGNTVLTADPSREFLEGADCFVRLGPGGGPAGGVVVATGVRQQLPPLNEELPPARLVTSGPCLGFEQLNARCLQIPSVELPLNQVVAICGISGSGKSTLLEDEILPRLRAGEGFTGEAPPGGVAVLLERALGSAAMSTVATLSGAWSEVRKAFADGEEGRIRGLSHSDLVAKKSRGGCRRCLGHGLDADRLPCVLCAGLGLREDLLELRLRQRSLREWLTTPLLELAGRLPHSGRLRRLVRILCELGMSERCLGERGRNLSLGERSRIALARELASSRPGIPRLFLLDEPCLGLPPEEAVRVVEVLRRLSSEGHSFWVVEHNEVLLRCADHLLELGPGAGSSGGQVVFNGPLEEFKLADTVTGNWLRSRIEGEPAPPAPGELDAITGEIVPEDFCRQGRLSLEHDLLREMATRSPLAADLLAGSGELGELKALPPVAWPSTPSSNTEVCELLGISGSIADALSRSGQLRCVACGGGGPWPELVEATRFGLCSDTEYNFTTRLKLQKAVEEVSTMLRAAGFRRVLRNGERVLLTSEVGLKSDDLVLLDTFTPRADAPSNERLREVEHHAKLLGAGLILARPSGGGEEDGDDGSDTDDFNYQLGSCRDCGVGDHHHHAAIEYRLGGYSSQDLRKLSLQQSLEHLQKHAAAHGPFLRALELLAGTSLLHHSGDSPMRSLQPLEYRLARLCGWLLYPVEGVVLLHDQPLAGFPLSLAKRLREEMLIGLHRFTDAESGEKSGADVDPQFKGVVSGFSLEFNLHDWADPRPAAGTSSLRQALGLCAPLRNQYLASEEARLRGWTEADLGTAKGAKLCGKCRGLGGHRPHPELLLPCPDCSAGGWDGSTTSLEVRGLSWPELGACSLNDLRTHFAGSSAIESSLALACELGMGEWRLDRPLGELPLGIASLAAFAATGPQHDCSLAIPAAGFTPLEAERIARTMGGYLSHGLRLEVKGHHPSFVQ